jgi:hydrogenase large subunit
MQSVMNYLDAFKLEKVKSIIKDIKNFVVTHMLEDVYTISEYYKDYFNIGKGYGNYGAIIR